MVYICFMQRQWKVLLYETEAHECPVRSFLAKLDNREHAKTAAWIALLKEHGINLHRPFADLLEEGIHELRMKITGDQIRILYFFCYRDYIILTHSFLKTTDKVPGKEITRAKHYRADFLRRYGENSIRRLGNDII